MALLLRFKQNKEIIARENEYKVNSLIQSI